TYLASTAPAAVSGRRSTISAIACTSPACFVTLQTISSNGCAGCRAWFPATPYRTWGWRSRMHATSQRIYTRCPDAADTANVPSAYRTPKPSNLSRHESRMPDSGHRDFRILCSFPRAQCRDYASLDDCEGAWSMLRSMNDLQDYAIHATDGTIGHVKDFYFDDQAWVVRYLVVETGTWLASRKVLISLIAIGSPNWSERILPVSITKEQVKRCPAIDTDKPVSRQHEMRYLGYYGYPYYWGGAGLWGGGAYPGMLLPGYAGVASTPRAVQSEAETSYARAEAAQHQDDDPHLRSCNVVMSYHIEASDG